MSSRGQVLTVNGKPVKRGQSLIVTFTFDPAQSISGWALKFTLRRYPGDTASDLVSKTTSSGITITDASSGVGTISFTAADLNQTPGTYYWDVWRTDSGSEDPLADGTLPIEERVRGN